jgi:NADPH:quinone reductase-like Zn-dependent oxidoreductase
MRIIVQKGHGSPDTLQLEEGGRPVPKDHEVLVRVHAATVTRGDVMLRKLHPVVLLPLRLIGIKAKRTPGHEFAGEVEAVGKEVALFKKGDEVFGTTTGLSSGANADYVCIPERWGRGVLTTKPSNMTYEEAAAVPVGGMTALYNIRRGSIQPGEKVLVYGASGSVGTFAVQLAKYFGAEVTGVCSTANLELVRSLGADHVVDYTEEDYAKVGQTYDVVFDAVGKSPSSLSKSVLKKNGRYLSVKSRTSERTENLTFLRELIEAGKVRSVIDRRFPLEDVAKAHRYVEKGHKRGNVVISVDREDQRD